MVYNFRKIPCCTSTKLLVANWILTAAYCDSFGGRKRNSEALGPCRLLNAEVNSILRLGKFPKPGCTTAEQWQNLPIQTWGRLFEEPVSAGSASGAWVSGYIKTVISSTMRSMFLLMELQLQTTMLVTAHMCWHLSGTATCVCGVPLGLARGWLQ